LPPFILYELNKHSFDAGTASELDLQTSAAQCRPLAPMSPFTNASGAPSRERPEPLIGQPLPGHPPPSKSLDEQNLSSNLPADLPSDCCNADRTFSRPNTSSKPRMQHRRGEAAFFSENPSDRSRGRRACNCPSFQRPAGSLELRPQISVPIFAGGRNRATLDAAKISTRMKWRSMRRHPIRVPRSCGCAAAANDAGTANSSRRRVGRSRAKTL